MKRLLFQEIIFVGLQMANTYTWEVLLSLSLA